MFWRLPFFLNLASQEAVETFQTRLTCISGTGTYLEDEVHKEELAEDGMDMDTLKNALEVSLLDLTEEIANKKIEMHKLLSAMPEGVDSDMG